MGSGSSHHKARQQSVDFSAIVVPDTASQILLHTVDRIPDGVTVIAIGQLQISSPNEFEDYLVGNRLEWLNDVVHGLYR
jgi:hypothetical protein